MKIKHITIAFLSVLVFASCKTQQNTTSISTNKVELNIKKSLNSLKGVVSVKETPKTSHFSKNFELWFKQPIDYKKPQKGTFKQRVLLGHIDITKPVIVELQGYGIYTNKAGELAKHYQANQITIEHRYFNNSRPKNIDWKTLTIKNAAKDQERIITQLKKIYPKAKFISTGISKGCQTTMIHRYFFPNNVDASVCYVGPLNFKREDPRIYTFLKNVGTKEDRDKILAFQKHCFKNKKELLSLFKTETEARNFKWEMGLEKALEYTILEYPFAFWQWGNSTEYIPNENFLISDIYHHLFGVVGYGFFEANAVKKLQPYFWAALTEQGIYGYETAPFKKYLSNNTPIYTFDWAFPKGIKKPFNPKPMQKLKRYLDQQAQNILFIYGEYDTWSATAVQLTKDAQKRGLYKFVKPKGDHKTRIKNFSKEKQNAIYSIINQWVK